MKFQRKEGERTFVLTVTPGNNNSVKTKDLAKHFARPEDGPRKNKSGEEKKRQERDLKEQNAKEDAKFDNTDRKMITVQWWKQCTSRNNAVYGHLFNHPRHEDGYHGALNIGSEYDVSRLQEGSLALAIGDSKNIELPPPCSARLLARTC